MARSNAWRSLSIKLCKACSRSRFSASGTGRSSLPLACRGRALYLKEKAWAKRTRPASANVAAKSASVSPGKPTIMSVESAMSGRADAHPADQRLIVFGRVLAVHRREDAIGARLEGEMQIGHQLRLIAEQRDQTVVHVARVAGGEAQPLDARHARKALEQARERPRAAPVIGPVIGVDVLPEQRDLARSAGRKRIAPRR